MADLDNRNFLAWQKAADERDKFRDQVRDTCTRAETAAAKFKLAATNLAAQAEEIAGLRKEIGELDDQADVVRNLERDLRLADETIAIRNKHIDNLKAEIANLDNMLTSEIANSGLVEADNAELKASFNQRLADAVQDYQADALLWRNARDRRAGKAVKS